jgi:hypothetical protein
MYYRSCNIIYFNAISDRPIETISFGRQIDVGNTNLNRIMEVIDMGGNPEIDEAMKMLNRWKKLKTEKHFIDLKTNEQVLVRAASEIYAAYIQRGLVGEGNEDKYISKAISEAINIAMKIDKLVIDVEEESK